MKIAVIGLNHTTAPVAIRERLAFPLETLGDHLAQLTALSDVAEGVILSTCNRVEVYFASRDLESAVAEVSAWLADCRSLDLAELTPHLYLHQEEGAVRHGFRVASSLDSMVVGEAQILGQIKQAFQRAVVEKSTGLFLNKYFHRVFQVAKRVRTETAIAENAVSIAFAAVGLAKRIFGNLEGHTCLMIGAGEMCELAARHMKANGVEILVTNRTFERAQSLAEGFDGHAFPLESLGENLDRADIVISSTGSTTYLVDRDQVKIALKRRRQKPMFLIDIAVPRDLDPKIAEVDSAFLYDIDDLQQIVESNRKDRGKAVAEAQEIIEEETPHFLRWLDSLEIVPTIVALRRKLEGIRDAELAKVLGGNGVSEEERKRLEGLTRLLINKILHTPTSRLRDLAAEPDGDQYVDATRKLFELE
ncbi:MAG: glutamyl-tRNA reductase [Magnetococcales bacterium]|nr:glutamyl-tRNA reductase [Magnetococcales bacterium]